MSKIKVIVEPCEIKRTFTVDFEDLNITEAQWNVLAKAKQMVLINDFLSNEPEQPYWVAEKLSII